MDMNMDVDEAADYERLKKNSSQYRDNRNDSINKGGGIEYQRHSAQGQEPEGYMPKNRSRKHDQYDEDDHDGGRADGERESMIAMDIKKRGGRSDDTSINNNNEGSSNNGISSEPDFLSSSSTSIISPPSSYSSSNSSSSSSSMDALAKTLSPARVDIHRKRIQRMLQQNSLLWWELVRYTRNLERNEKEKEQEQELQRSSANRLATITKTR
ncbi:hypothetical protein BGZ65_009702, partial [Modicella reniformis]